MWMRTLEAIINREIAMCCLEGPELKKSHDMHHTGVMRCITLFLAKKVDPKVTRVNIKKIMRSCIRCQLINSALTMHEVGKIQVKHNWKQLAVDVTHYQQGLYLTIIDCGNQSRSCNQNCQGPGGSVLGKRASPAFCSKKL